MKKMITLVLALACIACLLGCHTGVSENSDLQTDATNPTYKLKVEIDSYYNIVSPLKDAYEAGELITIKLRTYTEHYYKVRLNGIKASVDPDPDYTYFTFRMPSEDVLIEIELVPVDTIRLKHYKNKTADFVLFELAI